jgi:multiple sugar transport system permease protein
VENRKNLNNRINRIILSFVLSIFILVAISPIFWTLLNSFKILKDILTPVPKIFFRPTLENYIAILNATALKKALLSSVIVATSSVIIGFIIGTPFAYTIARFQFKARNNLRFWVITLRMMPPVATIFAYVYLWIKIGLLDTYISLIITYLILTIPTIIWLTIEPFRNVPIEIEESAMLEGATHARVFIQFALPIAWSTLMGGVLLAFVLVWNEFFFAFVLTSRVMTLPVAVGAYAVIGQEIHWGEIAAAMIVLAIPPFILASVFRKSLSSYFVVKV